jgi:hypothetical protein
MNPIDLIPFAEHSQKLPGKFLAPIAKQEKVSTWKILASHFIDFGLTFVATSVMTMLFSHSIKSILVTRSLQIAFSEKNIASLAAPLVPLMLFSYFFFSYFMNHGQTIGMMLFKRRIAMQSKSFYEAAKWAAHSLFLVMTCGLSYVVGKSKWQNIKNQDYLYQDLISYKEFHTINLLSRIDDFAEMEEVVEEEWIKAA